MTAWEIDDASWKRARREQWPAVEADLQRGRALRAGDLKVLKKYFLTGEADEQHLFKTPAISSFPFVFRVWLHPRRDQQTFDELRRSAHEFSLRYSEKLVTMLAIIPPRSLDDIIKRFYDVFYFSPGRRVDTFDPESGAPTWFISKESFPTPRLLGALAGWMTSTKPSSHPIIRYLISDIGKLTESEWALEAPTWDQVSWTEDVPLAVLRILQNPDDVRFETARTFVSMIENGGLPSDFVQRMRSRGLGS